MADSQVQPSDKEEQIVGDPGSERRKYIESLEKEVRKSAESRKFLDSTDGKYLMDWFDELISQYTNRILKQGVDHGEVIDLRARINLLRNIKSVLTMQGDETRMKEIQEQLKVAKTDE
jgi:hypothetical protein